MIGAPPCTCQGCRAKARIAELEVEMHEAIQLNRLSAFEEAAQVAERYLEIENKRLYVSTQIGAAIRELADKEE